MDIIRVKIEQAINILNELNIDLWMIFCRESDLMADPTLDMVIGHKVAWQSAFFIGRNGKTTALVGNFDAPDFERSGRFDIVKPYVEDCGKEIRRIIKRFNPKNLALNFSTNDVASDGLTHGMFLLLKEYLGGTDYINRIISSEDIVSFLRGRKIKSEIELISKAASVAEACWHRALKIIKPGMTEINIARIIEDEIKKSGAVLSFDTIVNAGAKTSPGHGHPTEAVLEPGDLLHVDFGAQVSGFCSDLQRLAYFKRKNEKTVPQDLLKAFNMVRTVINECGKLYRPGKRGWQIDKIARQILKDNGYEPYQHALGHQIGRAVHDGGAIVGPKWIRYRSSPLIPLEENNTFTIELGVSLDNTGYVGLEEDLLVTPDGGIFLCPQQTELTLL